MSGALMTKSGYKQTDVGLIPEEWSIFSFNDVFKFLKSGNNSREDLTTEGEINYIHYGDIHGETKLVVNCNTANIPFIDRAKVKALPFLQDGDLILVDASEDYEGIKSCIELKNVNDKKIVSGLHTIVMRGDKEKVADGYKAYIPSIPYVGNSMQKIANGLKVFGVSKGNLKKLLIPLPTLPEQQAIAEVLSDMDELIEKTQALIDKKRNIKTGAMHELLTPKEDSIYLDLRAIAEYKNGKSYENYISETGDYNLITLDSINIKGKLKTYHKKININDNSLEKNDLVMILSDVAHGFFLGLTDVIPDNNKYVLNQRVGALKNIKKVFPRYLSLYINLNQKYFKKCGQGSSQQNLSKDDILDFKVFIPSVEDQQRIVDIYNDMDLEIDKLEQQLEKYKSLKTGMMQELLTGKTRLV